MERRKFVKSSFMTVTALTAGLESRSIRNNNQKELYEWREYELRFGSSPAMLESYFKNALLPSLKKFGISQVGIFREISRNEPGKLFLLIPYPSGEEYFSISAKIKEDPDFSRASQEYHNLPKDRAVYSRFNTSLMVSFDSLPKMLKPPNEPRIFELRIYEGYSEDAVRRKIKMFNEGEIEIFYKTKLNPVFFGEVIAGKNLPCLAYLLTFKNMEERDKNWSNFSAHPDWKTMSQAPAYANTVSNIIRLFLEPLSYSGI